ncbi:MAG: ethanolamine ammonia-lyase subunit EutC [Spirochaetales bacterium]|nr:ethanolamine ammonia-lyase subunit EutC [Spirochaetales bacterium]
MKDITEKPMQQWISKDNKAEKALKRVKQNTTARIGIGRSGARYKTDAFLRFWADQSAASDAVFTEVTPETIVNLGLFEIKTKCRSKFEMITRPDWGRIIEKDQQQILKEKCVKDPDVQIYFGDGLSSPSISANAEDMLQVLKLGLEHEGLSVGTPFFVRYCRVNTARTIGPLLNAKVVCVLIGERPGMQTDESMSAYIAYKPHPQMLESEYTVVSNISRHGIAPVEAAAHIVELILKISKAKKSGISL